MRTRSRMRLAKWVIAGAVLAALSVKSDYLAELGAPPLRWKAGLAPKFRSLKELPPLDMGDPAPLTNAAPTAATNAPAPDPSEFFGPFPEDATSPSARMPGLPYQLDGMISPEWLSGMFYSPRTNGLGTLVLPVPFVPPPPPSRPSSAKAGVRPDTTRQTP